MTSPDSSAAVGASPTLTKHDSLWFDDGNVVITTDSNIAFRLHRGILSIHSTFFQDMFSLPHKEENDAVVDGCPAIYFSDHAEHLAWLFTLIYYGHEDPFFVPNHPLPFAQVRAMMMVGRKYGVDRVYNEALRRLRTISPTTLAQFDSFLHGIRSESCAVIFRAEDRVAIINMARSFDLPELLPFAFYICCTKANPAALAGVPSDGAESQEQLSASDLILCLQGMRSLSDLVKDMLTASMNLEQSYGHCGKLYGCSNKFSTALKAANSQDRFTPQGLLLPLEKQAALCHNCSLGVGDDYDSLRSTVWDSLEKIFQVQPRPASPMPEGCDFGDEFVPALAPLSTTLLR